jgi:hypothetical protein
LDSPREKPILDLEKEHLILIQLYDGVPKALRKDILKILKSFGVKK